MEGQISGPLPRRYLDAGGGLHDPRMLIVRHDETIVAVAAHRVERPPRIINDEPICPRYLEVIAVALGARGQRVTAPGEEDRSVGVFAFDAVVSENRPPAGPGPVPFRTGRPTPHVSLAFCDRVGPPIQCPDTDERTCSGGDASRRDRST